MSVEMMPRSTDLVFDTSMSMEQGCRDRQEDAVVSDFSAGEPFGFVVLADGMGGHAAGDVASKIVVTEMFSELKLQSGDPDLLEPRIAQVLTDATKSANNCLRAYASQTPEATGMGSTLLAPVLIEDRLYWISVGDSPLYLFRDDALIQLNEKHALDSQIDYLVSNGIMGREEALSYPDQSCLTSVLIGADIAQIDCRSTPYQIREGDILIVASDGLQYLSEIQIAAILRFAQKRPAEEIGAALMAELRQLNDPTQDNIALCVIKAQRKGSQVSARTSDAPTAIAQERYKTGSVTILARVTRTKRRAAGG